MKVENVKVTTMAAPSGRELFRRLSKEMKDIHRKTKLKDVPAYTYMLGQFKQNKVTGKRICKGENEVQHIGETYLTLLESVRKSEELTEKYKGKERTVEDSARLVGLQVPDSPANT